MSVPSFVNMGRPILKLFNTDFLDREIEFEAFAVTDKPGRDRTTFGILLSNFNGGTVGSLQLGQEFPTGGVTLTEQWTSALPYTLFSQVRFDDMPLKGAKMWLSLMPALHCMFIWSGSKFSIHGATNLRGHRIIRTGGVLSHQGWMLGGQLVYNVGQNRLDSINANGQLDGNTIAFGYECPSYSIHAHCSGGFRQFGLGYYNRVSRGFQVAGKIGWDKQTQATNLGMAAIFDSVYSTPDFRLPYNVKAKINDHGQMSLSANLELDNDVRMTLCSNTGLLTGMHTTFGLGIYIGEKGPGVGSDDCYNCCT